MTNHSCLTILLTSTFTILIFLLVCCSYKSIRIFIISYELGGCFDIDNAIVVRNCCWYNIVLINNKERIFNKIRLSSFNRICNYSGLYYDNCKYIALYLSNGFVKYFKWDSQKRKWVYVPNIILNDIQIAI